MRDFAPSLKEKLCGYSRAMFLSVAIFLFLSNLSCVQTPSPKPNIIYINIDDLGWTDLGFQGSSFYETPNIDRLAAQGMVFTNAYASAANCAPSRASSLTGQYSPRHRVFTVASSERGKSEDRKLIPIKNTLFIENENLTIAQSLKDAGYKTCAIGKWHISKDPLQNGFEMNIAGGRQGSPYEGYHSPYKYPNCEKEEAGEYLTDRLTDESLKFIKKNKGAPFFLYLSYYAVHTPLQAKPDLKEKFSRKAASEAHGNPTYAAMIAAVDAGVGRVMAALDSLDLSDNTLVLLTSDNGGLWGISKQWPLRAGKGSYYEGGIRVPMIVRWPKKIAAGGVCDVPVIGVDFFPTFLEAANLDKPKDKILDGQSLTPLFSQSGRLEERALFWHFPIYLQAYVKNGPVETTDPKFRTRPGSVIRYGDWKLHEYFEDGHLELYNLKKDPSEKQNLSETQPEKREELYSMLKTWQKKIEAPIPTTLNPEYKLPSG